MSRILIQNLRRIRELDFTIPAGWGNVFLLTGTNGAGKSTLLSCLSHITDEGILDRLFCPNVKFSDAPGGNIYEKASITYESDAGKVTYQYRDERWHPSLSPDDTRKILNGFGYTAISFVGANPKKVITAENLSIKDIKECSSDLKNALNVIFDEKKFKNLCRVTDPEKNEVIFLLKENIDGKDYYFSENNFSRGERAVLYLASKLADIPPHSLMLIDEAEMTLHPKAQKRLLTYLNIFAAERQIQVIVSTQSVSMIKIFNSKNILFLENNDDDVLLCRRNVYPAAILGEMAFAEEILPEMVLLVEDTEAAMLLEEIVSRLKHVVAMDFPYCKILPVGGYMQVVIMMDNFSKLFPSFVKHRAVLDKDAEGILQKNVREPWRTHHEVVSRNQSDIYYLPCTPEQGVVSLLEQDPRRHSRSLGELFQMSSFSLSNIMGEEEYQQIPGKSRGDCKDKMSVIVQQLSSLTGEPEYMIRRKLYRYYVQIFYADEHKLKQDYCPLIFKKGS